MSVIVCVGHNEVIIKYTRDKYADLNFHSLKNVNSGNSPGNKLDNVVWRWKWPAQPTITANIQQFVANLQSGEWEHSCDEYKEGEIWLH